MQATKYSLIMPYLNRLSQFRRTLQSLVYHYAGREDFEVVVVEDSKNQDSVHTLIDEFRGQGIVIRLVKTGREDGPNPAPLFNVGVAVCRGQFVVLTNPECLHMTNVLAVLDREFRADSNVYVVCACRHVKPESSFMSPDAFQWQDIMWYQHSSHRNLRYHFCSALPKDWYQRVGGFDERYADGISYDDDDFRDRVERSGIRVVVTDEALVFHQEHGKYRPSGWKGLLARNEGIYEATKEQ